MLLNKAFEDHVRDAVGEQEFERIKEHEAYRTALRDFDLRVKREFKGPDDPNEYVSFPRACLQDNEAKGIEQNAMILSGCVFFFFFILLSLSVPQTIAKSI